MTPDIVSMLPECDPPSFLAWYLYAAGLSKVPVQFHLWAALNTLAACVADRVWYEKFRDEKLYPNLYVMLIGPSGVGKNQAWRRAQRRIELMPDGNQKLVGMYRGKVSAEKMLSRLGAKQKGSNCIYLVTPELAMQVGSGPKAESFITHVTELFDADQTFQDDTRTSGHFLAKNPLINWGSGTTLEWMLRSVGKADILGGFFARICAIPGERSSVRYPKPIYPDDYAEVNAWLSAYLAHLTEVSGEFTYDDDAEALHDWWYDNRSEPENELLWHYYEHGDNIVHKLAMNLALGDSYKLVGEYAHMSGAIALYEWLFEQLGSVLEFAHRTPDVERLEQIARFLAAAPTWVEHTRLLRAMTNRGITREVLESNLKTLAQRGDVEFGRIGNGKGYRWIGD